MFGGNILWCSKSCSSPDRRLQRITRQKTSCRLPQRPWRATAAGVNGSIRCSRGTLQSKCMSTRHKSHQKSHFIQKFSGKMPRPRLGPERGHTLRASLRSRNACPHVTSIIRRATLDRNLQEKCHGPDTRTHTLCEPAQSKRMSRFHKSHFRQKFTGKMPRPRLGPERGHTLVRACAVETHVKISQEPLYAEIYR